MSRGMQTVTEAAASHWKTRSPTVESAMDVELLAARMTTTGDGDIGAGDALISAMSHLRFGCAVNTRVKDAQNIRAELYSVNETRVSSTRHDATRVMPCHTWDFNARPLNVR